MLGIDPWEFRLKNANRPGDLMPTRKVLEDPSTIDTIQACAEAVGHPLSATYRDMKNEERSGEWLPAAPGRPGSRREARRSPGGSAMKHRGRGLAAIEYPTGMNQGGDPSQAWVKIKPDGRVDVFAGTVDLGQGSKTVHTQIVADTLGVPYESVNMDVSNTDSSPLCTGTFASRGTFIGGLAVLKAAKKAKEKMLEVAGQAMEIDPADLDVEDGMVYVKGSPDKRMSVGEVSAAGHLGLRRADHRHRRASQGVFDARPRHRRLRPRPRDLLRRLRGGRRGRRRDRHRDRAAAWCRPTTSAMRSTRRSSRARSRAAP